MEDEEEQIRNELIDDYLEIAKERSFLFDNIDSFVALSRENTSILVLDLYPFDSAPGNNAFWDKVWEIVGNLTELNTIIINFLPYNYNADDDDDDDDDDDGDKARLPDWEILTRILPYLRRKVALCSFSEDYDAEVEDIQGLARAIHGHLMISEFESGMPFTSANVGPWCSALATLPSLDRLIIGLRGPEYEEEHDLLNLEPLKELLRSPALRAVIFKCFYFNNELCCIMGDALKEGSLKEGSSITDITFESNCSFPAGGRAIIANALKTNASVTDVKFIDDFDEPFCNALAAVLRCNSTLQNLTLQLPEGAGGRWLFSIFLSLGMNTTLKSLSVSMLDKLGDKLCAAIRNGLEKNSTLEELSLSRILPSDDNGAVSARNALSFLRTNSTLKSLTVSFAQTQKASYVSAFRLMAMRMLENTCLESLTITKDSGSIYPVASSDSGIKVVELLALISALQLNTTLKTLGFQSRYFGNISLTDDEANQLIRS